MKKKGFVLISILIFHALMQIIMLALLNTLQIDNQLTGYFQRVEELTSLSERALQYAESRLGENKPCSHDQPCFFQLNATWKASYFYQKISTAACVHFITSPHRGVDFWRVRVKLIHDSSLNRFLQTTYAIATKQEPKQDCAFFQVIHSARQSLRILVDLPDEN